ncbi:MAG: hypothetical protein DHS20C11_15220 [Lysobacteraceae bacterium]|nr:MAG: hypothetical protein DHS20C11_15220 [Xanthomonadaceae bacterium]
MLRPIGVLGLLLATGFALAEQSVDVRHHDWPLQATVGNLLVDNPTGDVRIRVADQAQPQILATAQYPSTDSPAIAPQIRSDERGTSVTVAGGALLRVDLVLLVPANLPLTIQTVEGRVIAKGLQSPIEVKAHNQLVRIFSHSDVAVTTRSGPVDVVIRQPSAAVNITTRHGPVQLELPGPALDVDLTTAGDVVSDSPSLLSRLKHDGNQRYTSDQSPTIRVHSETGNILLLADPNRHPLRLREKF